MPTVQFREGSLKDIDDLLALWRRADATPGITDTADDIRRVLDHPCAVVLLAVADNHIVGSVIGTFDGWRGNIYRLAVDPDYRRQGIALRLVREVEERLRHWGMKRTTALVEREHPCAVGFWDNSGYKPDQRDRAIRP